MYNDYAMLNLNEFETVAKEYNKILKVNTYSSAKNENNKDNIQLHNVLEECKNNINNLYNASKNVLNRKKIKDLCIILDDICKHNFSSSYKQDENVINPKLNYFNFKKLNNDKNFCNYVKDCLVSLCNALTLLNSKQDKENLQFIHNQLINLIGNCKYLK